MSYIQKFIKRMYIRIKYGKLTERFKRYSPGSYPAAIEYVDKNGNVIGLFIFGKFHPDYPYQG